MNIVIAMDSFKGCLSSIEAGEAIKSGIEEMCVTTKNIIKVYEIADGGEGTSQILTKVLNGYMVEVEVSSLIMDKNKKINCTYGIVDKDVKTAIIDIASAVGLCLVPIDKRNPLYTTTFGVGEIIIDALNKGCKNFIIGLGGSATNDGGVGMLQALGFNFYDIKGNEVALGAQGLSDIHTISDKNIHPLLNGSTITIASDVENPLCGTDGCSYVYAKQKGADDKLIKKMDRWMSDYADISCDYFNNKNADYKYIKGAGAAGGLGFAFVTFLQAKIESGIKIIAEYTHIKEDIKNADIVITGEGKLDYQTFCGKTVSGIVNIAHMYEKRVIALAGVVDLDNEEACKQNIECYCINDKDINEDAIIGEDILDKDNAVTNLKNTIKRVIR